MYAYAHIEDIGCAWTSMHVWKSVVPWFLGLC